MYAVGLRQKKGDGVTNQHHITLARYPRAESEVGVGTWVPVGPWVTYGNTAEFFDRLHLWRSDEVYMLHVTCCALLVVHTYSLAARRFALSFSASRVVRLSYTLSGILFRRVSRDLDMNSSFSFRIQSSTLSKGESRRMRKHRTSGSRSKLLVSSQRFQSKDE